MLLTCIASRPRKWHISVQLTMLCICGLSIFKLIVWYKEVFIDSSFNDLEDKSIKSYHFVKEYKNLIVKLIRVPGRTGLSSKKGQFVLDGKPFTIVSGAVHYFRFPYQYWRDRLNKMKACGLNTIETYVPWNKHEPQPGQYDFSGDLNLIRFLLLAKELEFLVLLRPGPYICSEWEFGGLPSWLLRDPTMQVRSLHLGFVEAVERYFNKLLPIIEPLQYKNGGPIIAVQLDNEYGAYFLDEGYIPFLKSLMTKHNINELLFVSDNIEGLEQQTIAGVLKTVNFKYVKNHFKHLQRMQPDAPLMVMELWTGWFDWWGASHHTLSINKFSATLNEILSLGASVNFYMFCGGTNFGFMNGGYRHQLAYHSDVTSYDYDALISENGDLTPKYYRAKNIIAKHYPSYIPDNTKITFSDKFPRTAYEQIVAAQYVSMFDILSLVPQFQMERPLPMEMLDINNGSGQAYGYILYRCHLDTSDVDTLEIKGFKNVFDRGILFVDFKRKIYIKNVQRPSSVIMKVAETSVNVQIDLLVENGGRINWLQFDDQRKGLVKPLIANEKEIFAWTIFPLEMKQTFINQLQKSVTWQSIQENSPIKLPGFFKFVLSVGAEPLDTYIDMANWGKGVVFVNGKNLGRYWSIGPQQSLYVPAPWLHSGKNIVLIFEEEKPHKNISFSENPRLAS